MHIDIPPIKTEYFGLSFLWYLFEKKVFISFFFTKYNFFFNIIAIDKVTSSQYNF